MKKILSVLLILLLLIGTLAACAEETPIPEEAAPPDETPTLEEAAPPVEVLVPEPMPQETPEPTPEPEEDFLLIQPSIVQIDDATDTFLSTFSRLHEFDYSLSHGSESDWSIVMWAEIPMRDFSIITVDRVFTDDAMYIFAEDIWRVAEAVLPGEAIVIHGYHDTGTLSANGFSFVDEGGIARYFTLIQNMGYPYEPGPYAWIIQEFDNSTGRILALMVS